MTGHSRLSAWLFCLLIVDEFAMMCAYHCLWHHYRQTVCGCRGRPPFPPTSDPADPLCCSDSDTSCSVALTAHAEATLSDWGPTVAHPNFAFVFQYTLTTSTMLLLYSRSPSMMQVQDGRHDHQATIDVKCSHVLQGQRQHDASHAAARSADGRRVRLD
jgi:hypothetical protein